MARSDVDGGAAPDLPAGRRRVSAALDGVVRRSGWKGSDSQDGNLASRHQHGRGTVRRKGRKQTCPAYRRRATSPLYPTRPILGPAAHDCLALKRPFLPYSCASLRLQLPRRNGYLNPPDTSSVDCLLHQTRSFRLLNKLADVRKSSSLALGNRYPGQSRVETILQNTIAWE